MHLDEIERQQEEDAAERAVEQQGQHVDAGEGARTKQTKRHHGRPSAPFVPDECNERKQADGQRDKNRHISRPGVGQSNQSECDAAQTSESQQ